MEGALPASCQPATRNCTCHTCTCTCTCHHHFHGCTASHRPLLHIWEMFQVDITAWYMLLPRRCGLHEVRHMYVAGRSSRVHEMQ
jgi:hypothetical protein